MTVLHYPSSGESAIGHWTFTLLISVLIVGMLWIVRNQMLSSINQLLKYLLSVVGVIIVVGLGACSNIGQSYPSVADIDRVTRKILTPQERKKAIDDMALENDHLRAETIQKIEKQ